jgi:hypothetical protein
MTFRGQHIRPYVIAILLVCSFVCTARADAEEDGYIQADRPGREEGSTDVEFFVFVLDIDEINGAQQNFVVNVFLRMTWKDERLAMEKVPLRTMPLEEIWNPQLIIANRQTFVRTSLPKVVQVTADGTVTYIQRFVGPLSQPLRLCEFPFDKHTFTIQFVATGFTSQGVRFVEATSLKNPDIVGGHLYKTLSLADWKILDYVAEERAYEPVEDVQAPGFVFEFTAKRHAAYYVLQVITPLVFIVMMSWGGFWIDPTNAGAQIGVATSSILTLIAYRFMLGNLIPRLPYMTRLDYFTLGSTTLVFLTLVEVIITTKLARSKMEKLGRRMDRWCRVIFPAAFAALAWLSLAK